MRETQLIGAVNCRLCVIVSYRNKKINEKDITMKITEKQIVAVAVNAAHLTGANVSNNIKEAIKVAFDRDLITDDIGRVAEIFKKDGYEINESELAMDRLQVIHYPGGRREARHIAFPYFIGEAQEYGFDSGVFNEYSAISSCHSCKEVIEFI